MGAASTAVRRRSRRISSRSAAGGVLASCGRAAAASAASPSRAGRRRSCAGRSRRPRAGGAGRAREAVTGGRGVARGGAARHGGVERRDRRRFAAASARDRVRQHRRVRRAVARAGHADEGLGEDVVQAEAGGVDHVAGEQRAERERLAVRLLRRPAGGDQPRGLVGGERGDRVRAHGARAFDGVAEGVGRARGELLHGLGRGERRVEDHHRGAHARGRLVDAGRVPVAGGHLRPRQRRRDGHRPHLAARRDVAGRDARARRRGERLGDVDHATAAQRDQPVAADRRQQPGRQLVDLAAADLVHGPGAGGDPRRGGRRAWRRQQRVAGPAEVRDRVLGGPEADRPLAVDPLEAMRQLEPRTTSTHSSGRRGRARAWSASAAGTCRT